MILSLLCIVGPAEGPGPGSYDTTSSQAEAEQKAFHGILANHGVGKEITFDVL